MFRQVPSIKYTIADWEVCQVYVTDVSERLHAHGLSVIVQNAAEDEAVSSRPARTYLQGECTARKVLLIPKLFRLVWSSTPTTTQTSRSDWRGLEFAAHKFARCLCRHFDWVSLLRVVLQSEVDTIFLLFKSKTRPHLIIIHYSNQKHPVHISIMIQCNKNDWHL